MNISMGLATLIQIVFLFVSTGLPGWMLYRVWLARLGLSWRVAVGLVLAITGVLYSSLATIFGYSLGLMLGITTAGLAGMTIWTLIDRRRGSDEQRPAIDMTGILFHLALMGVFIAPAFVLYLPLDTDAQGFGYLALMVREGGTIDTLAPWQPEVRYLYSPTLFVWWAFISDLFNLPLHQVMLPFSHLMAGMVAWLAIDLGQALLPGRPRMRWLMPVMVVLGLGLFLTLLDSAYTSVLGFVFVTLFLILAFHRREGSQTPIILMASVALAAVALTHPDTIIILLIGYIPFYATSWLSRKEPLTPRIWLRLFVLIPATGVLLTVPWLLRVWPLFFEAHVVSPFELSFRHVQQLVAFQGGLVPLLAVPGVIIALRRRQLPDILMLTWLAFILDFSMFGITDRVFSLTGIDIMRYVYPFSVAWHGPILVYAYLAAATFDTVLDSQMVTVPAKWINRGLAASLLLMLLAVVFQRPILAASRQAAGFFGAFSSRADLAAMAYLRESAPPDALLLNYPLGHEAHWAPVIAERESVTFRDQPFFSGAEPYYDRSADLADAYFDLAAEGVYEQIQAYGVTHLVVPQIINQPERFGDMQAMMRWRWPGDYWQEPETSPDELDWLELVFDQDGARVYRVLPVE